MDPINRGPEEYGHDNSDYSDGRGEGARPQRPPRDALTPDLGQSPSAAPVRTVQLITGDFLLTVNPVDGSEIAACPPGEQPARPLRHRAAERAELLRAARPPVPPGPLAPRLPLLERQEERERLVRLLARGRSVRLTGSGGSGRTALLDAVADDCAELAPDGVVRLSGYHRTPADLLHDLFAAVFSAPLHRPDRGELLELVHQIGAIVVLDDLEFGGGALDELLDATPECAFLLSATPETAAPSDTSHIEEVFLGGLGRSASLELLERAVERPLTDEEANWAGDLWFESEGLPLRFVQAGALLRQRDLQRIDPEAFDSYGYFEGQPVDAPSGAEDAHDLPLPSLGEGAAPAALLATRLSESARDTLRFAVALGGEVPHQAHLPALVGDTHADAALGELAHCGLLSAVGARYRLAAGVVHQLVAAGYGDSAAEGDTTATRAHTAAQHYAWWASHPSVTPERAAAEADAVLAALTALVTAGGAGNAGTAVELAHSAAPAFAAGLHWGAWERALRTGQEAARISGEVAEEAYFHHELGVLALCTGNIDRARAELEASIAMRGALADKRGTVAGRRALALVADRSGAGAGAGFGLDGRTPAGEEVPAARYEESASPPGGVPAAVPPLSGLPSESETVVTRRTRTALPAGAPVRRMVLRGARRNMVAAGAGALLAAVLVTVVTLGATSGNGDSPSDKGGNGQSVQEGTDKDGLNADTPTDGSTNRPGGGGNNGGDTGGNSGNPADPSSSAPGASGSSTQPGTTTGPPTTPGTPGKPSTPGRSTTPGTPTKPPSHTPTKSPTSPPPTTPTPTPTPTPSDTKTTTTPSTTTSASGSTAPTKTTTPPSTAPSGASSGTVPA
ncbi:ATP-binding protein [Streptomyces beijiangensis]|uniref:ATP-binding protein n=1 Tax=Streptomyces beijiangensis TaxID=163361 RepID=A0A939F9M9_9ACTN|nr:ATP-binding protein [Streptomyces beijiangensis]MBO0514088.1 ATP-binding protein [Streptomyces beijiangensis]